MPTILDPAITLTLEPAGDTVVYGVLDPGATPTDTRFPLSGMPVSGPQRDALDDKLDATGCIGQVVFTGDTTLTNAHVGLRAFVDSATSCTLTIGTEEDEEYRADAAWEVWAKGPGQVTIQADGGVSLNGELNGFVVITERYHAVNIVRYSPDEFLCTVPS